MTDGGIFAMYLFGIPVFYVIYKFLKLNVPFSLACFWPITAPILLFVAAIEGTKINMKKVTIRIRNNDGDIKKRTVRKNEKNIKVVKRESKNDVDIDDIEI